MRRPNILLVMADQLRHDCLGAVNPAIRTPNLDRLCREGGRFTRAYAPTPVCLPCRASVISGQFPSTHGACNNHTELPEDHPGLLPGLLRQRGYFTHMVGKSHLANCHDPCSRESAPHIHNLEHWRRWRGPWYGFERADLSIGHTVEAHACGMHYGAWLADRGVDRRRFFGNHRYTDFGAWDLPEEHSQGAWAVERAIAGIEEAGGRGQPFFTWLNFADPHNPCMVPEPWASLYDPASLPVYGPKAGERFDLKPEFYREILAQPGAYAARTSDQGLRGAGNLSHLAWDQATVQRHAAHYYGMVSMLDMQLGRLLAHLDQRGLADDTLIVFTSDHGDMLGEHGFWYKSLAVYDGSIRVPCIVRAPGHVAAGSRHDGPLSLVDLLPTFLAAAGAPPSWRAEGVDHWRAWHDGRAARRDVVIEERPYDGDWTQRILVDADGWKAAVYPGRTLGELYAPDDPDHLINLWDDPAHAARRAAAIDRILHHEVTRRRPNPDPTGMAAWDWTSGSTRFPYRQLGVIDL